MDIADNKKYKDSFLKKLSYVALEFYEHNRIFLYLLILLFIMSIPAFTIHENNMLQMYHQSKKAQADTQSSYLTQWAFSSRYTFVNMFDSRYRKADSTDYYTLFQQYPYNDLSLLRNYDLNRHSISYVDNVILDRLVKRFMDISIKQKHIHGLYILREDGHLPWLITKQDSPLSYTIEGDQQIKVTRRLTFQFRLIGEITHNRNRYFQYTDSMSSEPYYVAYSPIKINNKQWGYLCLFYRAENIKDNQKQYANSIIQMTLKLFSLVLITILFSGLFSIFIKYRHYMKRSIGYYSRKLKYRIKKRSSNDG